jgi:hypothetical protein
MGLLEAHLSLGDLFSRHHFHDDRCQGTVFENLLISSRNTGTKGLRQVYRRGNHQPDPFVPPILRMSRRDSLAGEELSAVYARRKC